MLFSIPLASVQHPGEDVNMCGFCGLFDFSGKDEATLESQVQAMADTMVHRGPDAQGVWADATHGVALGHRRLSILDLSPNGAQPMVSACDRFVLAYNGEVYNFPSLRSELEQHGHTFRGGSDTEVLLAAFSQWGIRGAVERFVGMFAFAVWDRTRREVSLCRDRLGIKSVYYGRVGSGLAFGSELKSLRSLPEFSGSINRDALALYFRHNYIPAPHSIYTGIHKLEPGTILTINADGTERREQYWSVGDIWQSGVENQFSGTFDEASTELERLLGDAVEMRMVADVPLGAFLSGGVDSSTVVALMQARSSRPVRTFSIGFEDDRFNEAVFAQDVANHLGTDHTELYVEPADLLRVVPEIPTHWDEPFADSSQIPTLLISRLAREHVTVSLSGDGGDELFAGYERYFWIRHWERLAMIPAPLRSLGAAALRSMPESMLGSFGRKLKWRASAFGAQNFRDFYRYLVSHLKDPASFVLGASEPGLDGTIWAKEHGDMFQQMTCWDAGSYLPDDILTKVDRASMAVSLEARVPILDHRVVEFASRVPTSMKVVDGEGKMLLKDVLYRHVPRELVDRPKKGFGVPIEHWLKNELRDWAESLLSPERIARQGYLDGERVETMWREYLNGERNWNYYLWDVLMFQAWLEEWEA